MAPIKKSIYIQLKNFPTLYIYSVLPVPLARARKPQLNASRTAFRIPKNNISLPTSFFSPRNDKHMQSFFLLTNNSSKKELFKRSLNRRNLKTPAAPAVWFSCRRKTELLFRKRWPYRDAIVFELS